MYDVIFFYNFILKLFFSNPRRIQQDMNQVSVKCVIFARY